MRSIERVTNIRKATGHIGLLIRFASLAAFAILTAGSALASTIAFSTPGPAQLNGLPVSASATFDTYDGYMTVTLQNFQADPKSVIQTLSGLTFDVNRGNLSIGSYSSSSSTIYTYDPTVIVPTDPSNPTKWIAQVLGATASSTAMGVCVLCNQTNDHLIVGPPGSNGSYDNSNGSIGSHQPFLFQSASFTINSAGLLATDTVSGAAFSFGTGGVNVNGVSGSPVPEPQTITMFAAGLGLVLASVLSRRFRKSSGSSR